MTNDDMKVCKGLRFPVVALLGVGHMPAKGKDEKEAARVINVAVTRYAEVGDWSGWAAIMKINSNYV